MNILFTICGRAGSKGIKNKNLREFLGYPLPFYTASAIDLYRKQNPDVQCDVVLNTDSKDLAALFKERVCFDVNIIERDESLGLDSTPKVAVILNCLEIMRQRKAVFYDMVVDLDVTSPLRTAEDVRNLIENKIISNADVVFSVTDSRRNPYFNMVKKQKMGMKELLLQILMLGRKLQRYLT